MALCAGPDGQHTEVMRQQFFQNQPALCGMLPTLELAEFEVRRRAVQRAKGFRQA